jgi:hypothetical protein
MSRENIFWNQGTSLSVGSGGLYRDLFLERGTYTGTLSDILSRNQGGTWYTQSHWGFPKFTNPNSVSAESLCIAMVQAWNANAHPGDWVGIYDRVWACRGIHTNTAEVGNVTSLPFVRSFDGHRAELWAFCIAPMGATASSLAVGHEPLGGFTFHPAPVASLFANVSFPLLGTSKNGAPINRVTRVEMVTATGAAGELGLVLRVPKIKIPLYRNKATVLDAFKTALTTVASNECLELVYYRFGEKINGTR